MRPMKNQSSTPDEKLLQQPSPIRVSKLLNRLLRPSKQTYRKFSLRAPVTRISKTFFPTLANGLIVGFQFRKFSAYMRGPAIVLMGLAEYREASPAPCNDCVGLDDFEDC